MTSQTFIKRKNAFRGAIDCLFELDCLIRDGEVSATEAGSLKEKIAITRLSANASSTDLNGVRKEIQAIKDRAKNKRIADKFWAATGPR
jgi:hypothetical protein